MNITEAEAFVVPVTCVFKDRTLGSMLGSPHDLAGLSWLQWSINKGPLSKDPSIPVDFKEAVDLVNAVYLEKIKAVL